MLVPLAEELDRLEQSIGKPCDPSTLGPSLFMQLLKEDSLKMSAWSSLAKNSCYFVDPYSIPRSALCEAIFLPPYVLVHTPGLFEGALVRDSISAIPQPPNQRPRSRRMKL
jgi:hypothetical protein